MRWRRSACCIWFEPDHRVSLENLEVPFEEEVGVDGGGSIVPHDFTCSGGGFGEEKGDTGWNMVVRFD